MEKKFNLTSGEGRLYYLVDGNNTEIVAKCETVETLVDAYYDHVAGKLGTSCVFYKIQDNRLSLLEDNELPEEFLYGYDDEYEEYDDGAYCPVCNAWYI